MALAVSHKNIQWTYVTSWRALRPICDQFSGLYDKQKATIMTVLRWAANCAIFIQQLSNPPSHTTCLKLILLLLIHINFGINFPSGKLPSDFRTKILHQFLNFHQYWQFRPSLHPFPTLSTLNTPVTFQITD